jgi:hypothetical protein
MFIERASPRGCVDEQRAIQRVGRFCRMTERALIIGSLHPCATGSTAGWYPNSPSDLPITVARNSISE